MRILQILSLILGVYGNIRDCGKESTLLKIKELPMKSKINGLPLNMTFDTGASDILISQTEVDFMLKNGYLTAQDFIGTNNYYTASEEKIEARTVMLRQVEIGGLVLRNVRAAVIKNRMAGMLFGQSAMSRYGKITIDNQKKQIILTGNAK